ncbi:uncharacterized protein V1516DRAFT_679428 [Lipomyces oligophaga]|uniref:uncharacterized protein n=1 Tax=Lipomyces oligophaga TaxID=45792 RepID=UPI0034CE6484
MEGTQDNGIVTYIEAIAQLPRDALSTEQARLENSIKHLERSNEEIENYIEQEARNGNPQEEKELKEVIEENQFVISGQKERIELVKGEIRRRR